MAQNDTMKQKLMLFMLACIGFIVIQFIQIATAETTDLMFKTGIIYLTLDYVLFVGFFHFLNKWYEKKENKGTKHESNYKPKYNHDNS